MIQNTWVYFGGQWITNTKTAALATAVFYQLLKAIPAAKLVKIEGFSSALNAFTAYGERQEARLDSYVAQSFVLDFVLRQVAMDKFFSAEVHEALHSSSHDFKRQWT